MGFLDRLFGAPTLKSVVRDVTRELQQRDAQDLRVDLPSREMSFRMHGGEMRLFLGNLLHDLQHCRRADRPALLQRFLEGMLSADNAIPASYAEARPQLMPVIRRRGDVGIVALTTRAASGDPDQRFTPATKALVDDLVIALVCDRPTSMAYVNEHELPKWEVTFDQALADALDNLRALPEHGGWQQLGAGVWSGEWGDAYDSSRILLPDLIHRVGVRDPVVAVPFRNALMLTSAGNDAGIALMAQVIADHAGENQRWLSFQLLRLHETEWRRHAPQAAVADWHLLNLRNEATLYDTQKELLDAFHERTTTDIFVASFQVLSLRDAGNRSFGVWADGVDTLLPRADLVAFAFKKDGASQTLMVRWTDVCSVVGELMEATDESPERWRVRRFPDAAQLAILASLAVQP
jgi:hypothetical protein